MSKPGFSGKPESAIKRADEFIEVDKYDDAIDVLFDVLRNKRHRDKVNEQSLVINKFCQLCVDHGRTTSAKDGLYQFRVICSQNLNLFHSVVEKFLNNSNEKLGLMHSSAQTRSAQEKSVLLDLVEIVPFMRVDELDIVYTPEDIICQLARPSIESGRDNLSLISFMRFIWDNFRNMLDLVKNNKDHEKLYQDVAKRSMEFCITYRRKAEFRKLCEILRGHLILIQRHQEQETSVDLTQVDSIQRLMDIRLDIIETAIKIDSCQEAFKALEECHHLIELSRAARTNPRSQLLASYFEKQATVYLMANDLIFHSAALVCSYLTYREDKRFLRKNPDFFRDLASKVVLATLSTPHTHHRDLYFRFVETEENFHENEKQLSSYLYLNYVPTRMSLLDRIRKNSILDNIPSNIKRIFQIMMSPPLSDFEQKEFSDILESLEKNKELSVYITYIKIAFAIELIILLSKFYDNISFTRLRQTVSFLQQDQVESCLITIFKYLHYHVKVDHNKSCISFPSSISFPVSSLQSNPTNVYDSSDLKLSQLKFIHSLFSKCIVNSNDEAISEAFQTLRNYNKEIFLTNENVLPKYFAKRRSDLEKLQNQQEQRKKKLRFQIIYDSPPILSRKEIPPKTEDQVEEDQNMVNPPKVVKPESKSINEKPVLVASKPKLEEKPKDPNRYKQNEKSLDFIFRAQREQEMITISENQMDKTYLLSNKWVLSERNRVTAARELYSEKIALRDRVCSISDNINSLKSEIMESRLKSSQDSQNLIQLFDNAKQILIDERRKSHRVKPKQNRSKNQAKQANTPGQNKVEEHNNPKVYKKPPLESNTPPSSRKQDSAKPENTSSAPGVYVPPHLKNQGKHP